MATPVLTVSTRCHFSPFTFDREREQLLRGTQPVRLRPKTLALLRFLLEHPGQVVERDALMAALWPDVAVTDVVLNVCVAELRRALGDDRAHPRYVETVHRRGFRFIAPLEVEPAPAVLPGNAPGARPREAAFVGRAEELRRIDAAWRRACGGELQIALVTGGAGIGKSSVVERFLRDLPERGDAAAFIVGRGQCLDLGAAHDPFLPVIETLGALCAGPFGAEIVQRLRAAAPAVLPHLPVPLEAEEDALLRRRFAHRGPESMLRDLARGLVAVSEVAPLVLVLEDLHWGDGSTVDLIAALAGRRDPARVLLLGTMRPGEAILAGQPRRLLHLHLRARDRVTELPLDLLDERDVHAYLEQSFGSGALATSLTPWLAERTDGNPLFLAAIVEHLVSSGVVRVHDGVWSMGDVALPTTAPASLARLLRDRMASIDPAERRALEAAAVCGIVVASQAVAAGVECTVEEAETLCQSLAERHLMLDDAGPLGWPDGSIAQSHRFRHALYRQVVESAIPAARLRILHARIAAALERAFAGSTAEVAAQLAGHFHAAGDDARTSRYAKLAARRASARGGYREAIAHLRTAREALATLPLATRDKDDLSILVELAPLVVSVQGLNDPETSTVLARMRELSSRTQESSLQVSTLSTLATTWRQRGEVDAAAALSRELLAIAAEVTEPPLRLAARMVAGTTAFHASDFATAREHLEACLEIGGEGDLESSDAMAALSLAAARGHLAALLWLTGFPAAARRLAEGSLEGARSARFSPVASMTHALAAWAFVLERDFTRVEQVTCADAILASDPPLPLWTATTAVMRGWAWVHLGRTDEGLAEVEVGYRSYLDALGEPSAFDYQVLRCEAFLRAGRLDETAAMLDEALENLRVYKQGYFAPELYRVRGELLASRGGAAARTAARAAWREGLVLARERGARSCALRLALAIAGAPDADADRSADRALVGDLLASFDDAEGSPDLTAARWIAGAA